jgi:hypothetical protein
LRVFALLDAIATLYLNEHIFIHRIFQPFRDTLLCDSDWASFNVLLGETCSILENEDTANYYKHLLGWELSGEPRKTSRCHSDGVNVLFEEQV